MIKHILYTCSLFLLIVGSLQGQNAEIITAKNKPGPQKSVACIDQYAGTVSQGEVIAQSVATGLPGPIFLCYQDRFTIFNSGADLTGDPDLTTQPGVGYAFFECPPTATGPTLADIEADACVLTPLPTSGDYDLWVYTDQPDGTALFQNSDQLNGQTVPEFFNGGNPIQIYFAPITFDDFGNNQDEDGGLCVNMTASEAFPVVYLNEIEILNCDFNLVNNEFVGSFVVEGGYPEYNGSAYTSVAVIKNNNFNNQAEIIGGPFMHGDIVNFIADEPGVYSIVIQDGISCGASKAIEFNEEEKVLIVNTEIPVDTYEPGDYVCVTFTVADFDSITSMQWTINFDPNVLQWDATIPCAVEDLSEFNLPTYGVGNGFIPFQWFQNAATGVDLNDGDCLFDICFDVVGDPGDCVDIFFDGTPTQIAVSCCENSDVQLDANGASLCIEEPLNVEIFASTCGANGNDEGSISFYFVGGTPPYQYGSTCFPNGQVNTSLTTVTINDLPAGPCTVDYFDAGGIMGSVDVVVSDAPEITYDIFTSDPTCYGVPNAKIALRDINGGAPDYEVAWSSGIYGVDSIQFLSGGTYFATITDQDGCEVEQAFVVGTDPIYVDLTVLDTTSCVDTENGSMLANAYGGTPMPGDRYTYQWNNPTLFDANQISSTNVDVPAGIGTVRVTDDNGCSVTVEYDMPFIKSVSAEIEVTQPLCAGDLGSVLITGTTSNNSCSSFVFDWSFGVSSPTTTFAEDLEPGDYPITIIDCDGCMIDTMFTIEDPAEIMLPFFADFSCSSPTGSITIFPGGGTGNISLTWADDSTITSSIRNDLPPGEYTVTAVDENMCDTTITIELSAGVNLLPDTFLITPIACAGDMDGVITVDVPGGGGFDYTWDGPEGMIYPNDPTITGVGAGEYFVTISDGTGCEAVDSVELLAPDTIYLNPVITLPSCNGEGDAQIALVVTGGDNSNGYSYSWSGFPGNVGPILTNIGPGSYDVTVFDSQGCSKDSTIVVDDQIVIDIMVNILDDLDCNGETDAIVEVVFSGGPANSGNYGVRWSSGEEEPLSMITTDTAYLLTAGTNQVIVFDEVCADTLEFELTEPEKIILDLVNTNLTDASCFGSCDGIAEVAATGGVGEFTYSWPLSGNVGAMESDLCSGKYYVDIMDENGCIVTDSITIGEPDSLDLNIDLFNTFNPACNSEGDGIITVDYTGGNVGPVTYTWTDDVSDDAAAIELVNGLYGITVTDINGCTDTTSYELSSPPPVEAMVPSPEEPTCFGERTCIEVLDPSGGSGEGYRFSINNSSLFPIDSCVLVFAGEYIVSIFDSEGCSFDTTIVINQPSEMLASVIGEDLVALGDSVSILEVVLNQDFIIDTIIWDSTSPFECIDDDCTEIYIYPSGDALYTVTAIDENGCIATSEILIRIDDERKVYIPNIFSPNGDGINDQFQLYTGQGVTEVVIFQVFDRWGNKMFEVEDLSPNPAGTIGWDGTFKGQNLDPGVFAYRAEITFIDGKTIPYTGSITIIR